MSQNLTSKKAPPKFAIENGFVIGSFPQKNGFLNKVSKKKSMKIKDNELTDQLKAMLAPVRPYGCVFAYSGGSQKYIRELSFFSKWTETGLEQSFTI